MCSRLGYVLTQQTSSLVKGTNTKAIQQLAQDIGLTNLEDAVKIGNPLGSTPIIRMCMGYPKFVVALKQSEAKAILLTMAGKVFWRSLATIH
jgi:hypothetical protein